MHIYLHVYTYSTQMHAYSHVYTCTHINVYIHLYTYICIHADKFLSLNSCSSLNSLG